MLLWIKAFHIIFVICWFAGIFYLPRLFVNNAMCEDKATTARLNIMQRKLYRFITPFAYLSIGLGLIMVYLNWEFYKSAYWMHAKIALVFLLFIYHHQCGRIVMHFESGTNQHGHIFYRWFNEMPVLILFAVVILVVVRPF